MKISTVIIAIAVARLAGCSSSQPIDKVDSGSTDHNRTNSLGLKHGKWTEFPEREDVLSAEGEYVDGKPHGKWVARGANGDVAEGEYMDGKESGHWVARSADGSVLDGEYVDGKRHGHWVVRFANGQVDHVTYRNGGIVKVE